MGRRRKDRSCERVRSSGRKKGTSLEALLRIAIVERNFVGGTAKERKESCLIRGESSVSMTQGVALALIW
jgi:hypothetical protein